MHRIHNRFCFRICLQKDTRGLTIRHTRFCCACTQSSLLCSQRYPWFDSLISGHRSRTTPVTSSTRSRGLISANGHWQDQWESNGLARRNIKSAIKEDRRFIDDNRFGCCLIPGKFYVDCFSQYFLLLSCFRSCNLATGWDSSYRCHFTATGMPYSSARSPRISKVCTRTHVRKIRMDRHT